MARERGQLKLLSRRHVEHDLRLEVGEAKCRAVVAEALQKPLHVALTHRHEPRSTFRCAERTLGDHGGTGCRDGAMQFRPGATAFPYCEVDPCAGAARTLLR